MRHETHKQKGTRRMTAKQSRVRVKELRHEDAALRNALDRLCEITPNRKTYEVLGEMFLEFILQQTEYGVPSDDRVFMTRKIRFEIYEMYELAQTLKELRSATK